jgi:hypothetical protein
MDDYFGRTWIAPATVRCSTASFNMYKPCPGREREHQHPSNRRRPRRAFVHPVRPCNMQAALFTIDFYKPRAHFHRYPLRAHNDPRRYTLPL